MWNKYVQKTKIKKNEKSQKKYQKIKRRKYGIIEKIHEKTKQGILKNLRKMKKQKQKRGKKQLRDST